MLENTNIKQFYPGPILNKTLDITDFLFKDPEQVHITYTYKNEDGSLSNRELTYGTEYEVAKILPSDVTQVDAVLTASTGRVTLKANLNVALGERLTIYRESEIVQETQYPRTGPFPAASHEGALDYLTMQNQEQQDQIDRSLKVPISTANFDGALPIPVPARALKINNSGSGFELSEYDPDAALETTKEYRESAQTAASNALASQNAAASSASSAASSETVAIQQANIAIAKTAEITETYNNAMVDITTNKDQSMSAIDENRISSVEEISNTKITAISDITTAGTEQIANIKQTGFYMRDDKLYFINSQGEETEFKSGGSGLEICDIGMALYIDETKGLRRYLNGQIVDINTNTQAFLNRLKQIQTTNPDYFTTEDNWQAEALLNIDGCVYKFVLNYSGDSVVSVRLPKYPDYVENNAGGTLPVVGNGMTLGLTNGTTNYGLLPNGGQNPLIGSTSAFGKNVGSNGHGGSFTSGDLTLGVTQDPTKSGIQTTLKQTKIKMRYFIQIATGSETENNIINDIELNNPYSLFDSKYSDHELNNLSWLKSEGQWNSKAVYVDAYNELLAEYNNSASTTETEGSITFKRTPKGYKIALADQETVIDTKYTTDGIAWYYILDTANEKFKLPRTKFGFEGLRTSVGDDIEAGLPNITGVGEPWNAGGWKSSGALYISGTSKGPAVTEAWSGSHGCFAFDASRSNPIYGNSTTVQSPATQMYLYFYVGETVQNANLIDAGRIGEQLANKTDMLQASGAGMPSSRYIDLTLGESGSSYTAPANGWFSIYTANIYNFQLFNTSKNYGMTSYGKNGLAGSCTLPVNKSDVVKATYDSSGVIKFRFIYAEGSK